MGRFKILRYEFVFDKRFCKVNRTVSRPTLATDALKGRLLRRDSRSTLETTLWAWSPMCGLDLKSHKMFIAPYDIPNNIHLVCVAVKWAEVTPDLFCGHLFEYGAGCVGGINKSSLRDHPGTIAGLCWKFQASNFKTVGGVVNFTPKSASKIYLVWIYRDWVVRYVTADTYT